ncbi:Crp/Fnr family transcriptional regulator [Fulvivirga sediminis]|uniref:Crp/Fnr family transcriptional regulator n=1 Tax=Fulvivirga sediminis TaxID=2803949 RepID=A0A937FE34_9BACT|nr:Crp/Fnr family transcriptional regulator [Fulvivirga sediminis]MBL3658843.1 Crp/Fnr family transcriptional regulator [Fulvivirga sediminis]
MEEAQKYFDSYLKQFGHLSDEIISFLRPHLSMETRPKGAFYLQKGEVQAHMGYVNSGLLRRYYINEKGNEITTGFIKEREYVTDYPAFIRQQPTKYFMQCLEPCIIINLPYEIIQESYSRFKSSEMQGRLIAEMVLTILSDRVESFLFNTAEERYLAFLSDNEDLMNRVSLTHLASFLGIERQSLSRIRKRITQK